MTRRARVLAAAVNIIGQRMDCSLFSQPAPPPFSIRFSLAFPPSLM